MRPPTEQSKVPQIEQKHNGTASTEVHFKDLHIAKFIEGAFIQASVLEFYSPDRFYLLSQSVEMLEALTSISSALQRMYSSSSVSSHVPCVGEVCAVQYSLDLNWYRGLIQTLTHDQKIAKVLYIDFGNEEDVPVGRIRALLPNTIPFGPCAMECCITNVLPMGDAWTSECCTAVRQMLVGKTLTVHLLKNREPGRCYVVDLEVSTGKQLSTFLTELGYAKKMISNTPPTKQEMDAMKNASLENFRRLSDGKDENTWAQPPQPVTQAVGDRLSVVVIHFQSPSDFIIQKVENSQAIQDLQLKLKEHCGQSAAPKNFRPAPGTVCCAQFSEDKQWYRAKVLAYSSEDCVCVGYIDFGNSEVVDLSHLFPINMSLLELPMQAMPCGLAGVQPVEENWSEDCISTMKLHVSNRILQLEIQGVRDGKAMVSMIMDANDPQTNVAELLICVGYAVPTRSDSQADVTDSPVQPQGDSPPVCEPLVWHEAVLPRDNQTVALQVIAVENPGEFYCCINSPADQQQLIELGAQLKLHCEADKTSFVPKVGEPCAVCSGDGSWRRAMVKGLSEDGVTVKLVDHGYTMTLKTSSARSITPKFLKLPFQAARCWLAGVAPLGSEWSGKSIKSFLKLVEGKQLSARVVSVTELGFGVELESQGRNVAVALISEHLVRAPGELPEEAHVKTGQLHGDGVKANEHSQLKVQTPHQTESSGKAASADQQATVSSEEPSFPVDWKTVELPLNIFKPGIAAAISPTLFYVLSPVQVDLKKRQELMEQVAAYCSKNQTASSAGVTVRPAPGAACCAQFSVNKTWYRAVVLEVGEAEVKVIHADFGSMETVPFSRILPIPLHLLQLPFQITRCTLLERKPFPAGWPEEATKMFQTMLSSGVLATVHSFNGSANVLALTLPTQSGGEEVTSVILDALQRRKETNASATLKSDQIGKNTSDSAARQSCAQLNGVPKMQNGLKDAADRAKTPSSTQTSEDAVKSSSAAAAQEDGVKKLCPRTQLLCQSRSNSSNQETSCCCLSLKTQMDHLEQLIQLQLSLIKQIVGQRQ